MCLSARIIRSLLCGRPTKCLWQVTLSRENRVEIRWHSICTGCHREVHVLRNTLAALGIALLTSGAAFAGQAATTESVKQDIKNDKKDIKQDQKVINQQKADIRRDEKQLRRDQKAGNAAAVARDQADLARDRAALERSQADVSADRRDVAADKQALKKPGKHHKKHKKS